MVPGWGECEGPRGKGHLPLGLSRTRAEGGLRVSGEGLPLDGAVVLVDEVPGLAQQLLRGRRALGGSALQFPWKHQGAQAASGGAGPVLGRGGGWWPREQGASDQDQIGAGGQGLEAESGAEGGRVPGGVRWAPPQDWK